MQAVIIIGVLCKIGITIPRSSLQLWVPNYTSVWLRTQISKFFQNFTLTKIIHPFVITYKMKFTKAKDKVRNENYILQPIWSFEGGKDVSFGLLWTSINISPHLITEGNVCGIIWKSEIWAWKEASWMLDDKVLADAIWSHKAPPSKSGFLK